MKTREIKKIPGRRKKKVKAKREREWKTKQMKRREAQAWAYFEDAYFNVNVGDCSVLYIFNTNTQQPNLFSKKIASFLSQCCVLWPPLLELNCGVFSLLLEFDATFPPQLFGVGTRPYFLFFSFFSLFGFLLLWTLRGPAHSMFRKHWDQKQKNLNDARHRLMNANK